MVNWYLGTMGFSYKDWVGPFYPAGMALRDFLTHYAKRFDAVEIDSTFYGIPKAASVQRWTAVTPPHFTFCPKTPRTITHALHQAETPAQMAQFLDTMRLLADKCGPILLQFPPDFAIEQWQTLDHFLKELPTGWRYALEFRHRSWATPQTADLLQKHNVCWAATDYIYLPKKIWRTTDFLYLRFIGRHGRFPAKDREQEDKTAALRYWQQQIEPHLQHVNAVYGFFNNDYSGHSPTTCNRFKKLVGLEAKERRPPQQGRLF